MNLKEIVVKAQNRLKANKISLNSLVIGLGCALGSIWLLIAKSELLPTFWIGCLAAYFSSLALKYSEEKFCLDLLDKRMAVYMPFMKFIVEAGVIYDKAEHPTVTRTSIFESESHKEFSSISIFETIALFGKDVPEKYHEILCLLTEIRTTQDDIKLKELLDNLHKLFENSCNVFDEYVYFGGYKIKNLDNIF